MAYLWLILGLAVLVVSGEVLVKGATQIAYRFKISPLVVGMTIVSFGTSAPELLVSLKAALGGQPDIAMGNIIGSNISNLALVLGLTALIFPIVVDVNSIKIDWPAMMGACLLLFVFILDGELARWEGAILLVGLIIFVYWLIKRSMKQNKNVDVPDLTPLWRDLAFLLIGCVGLAYGAGWFLDGAIEVAQDFGMSDKQIGVTIIAFGTSVPELVTSCVAAFRKQTDISIGNLIGSNLLNVALILGMTSIVSPIPVGESIITSDIYWMLGIAAIVLPFMYFGRKIGAVKGLVLFATYVTYIYLVL